MLSATTPLVFLLLFVFTVPALGRSPHLITFYPRDLSPSFLSWDPSSQHFLVGSLARPAVASVSDAGVLEIIILDKEGDLPVDASFAAIALDLPRRRLLATIASLSSPAQIAAYDLNSPRPHARIFLSTLPSDSPLRPSGVAVEPSTGTAYVTAAGGSGGLVWRVDAGGKAEIFSKSKAFGVDPSSGLDGITYVSKGYLLVAQRASGTLFKLDPDNGSAARAVLLNRGLPGLAGVTMRSDGSAVAFGESTAWILKSEDGWGEAGVYDKMELGEGRKVRGVAVREGKSIYVLTGSDQDEKSEWRIEEVESERETSGEKVAAMIMLGIGFAIFFFWRFQMRQLAASLNKKTA